MPVALATKMLAMLLTLAALLPASASAAPGALDILLLRADDPPER